jgi:hypothetical protein
LLRLYGPVALLLRDFFLLGRCFLRLHRDHALFDRDPPLPVGEPGEDQGEDKASGETAGENIPAPCRRLQAAPDETLCFLRRRRRIAGPPRDPALRLLQHRRAQQ